MRPSNVPAAPYQFEVYESRSPRDLGSPPSPVGLGALLVLIVALASGGAYWLLQQDDVPAPSRRSERAVGVPDSAVRELRIQLENAKRLNADAISEMSRVQRLIREIAPYFRNNGFETNNRRAVEIDNRALSAMRLTNQSSDEITFVLDQLTTVKEEK